MWRKNDHSSSETFFNFRRFYCLWQTIKYSLTCNWHFSSWNLLESFISCGCRVLQLFKDLEASSGIYSSARAFAVCAAAAGIKIAAVMVQPGAVIGVRVFEGHDITVLHRGTISSVPGKDLERYVIVDEPAVTREWAGRSVEKENNFLRMFTLKHCFHSANLPSRWHTWNLLMMEPLIRSYLFGLNKGSCMKIAVPVASHSGK